MGRTSPAAPGPATAAVVARDRLPANPPRTVGGADAAYSRDDRIGRVALAVMRAPFDGEPVCLASGEFRVAAPYRPGRLAEREAGPVLELLEAVSVLPDVLLVDGHGLAHPRRFGLACAIGVAADLPTIGVAKSPLVGRFAEPGPERGSVAPVIDRGETVGAAVRTRTGVRPVFVSVGHRVSLETAVAIVLACSPRFRIPEPLRAAHRAARRIEERARPEGPGRLR